MEGLEILFCSVVIPSYNAENTIVSSVESVLQQIDQETCVVVVDDCSVDRTIQKIASIKDGRLKIVQNLVNQGANKCRNQGVRLFDSQYVFFHDADDVWLPDKFLEFRKAIDCNPEKNIFFSRYLRSYGGVEAIVPHEPIAHMRSYYANIIPFKNIVGTPTLCVKTDFFKKIGGFDESMPKFQDWEFAIRAFSAAEPVIIDRPLVKSVVLSTGITRNIRYNPIGYFLIFKKHFTNAGETIQGHWARLVIYSAFANLDWITLLRMFRYPRAIFYAVKGKITSLRRMERST